MVRVTNTYCGHKITLKQYVLNASDASEDFDYDGLTNLQEYQLDTSLDCDHDGINDSDELHYWNVTRGLPLNESIASARTRMSTMTAYPTARKSRATQ